MTYGYDVAPEREEEQRQLLTHRILPPLVDRPGIAGVHLCLADRAASSIETEEKKNRADKTAIPNWGLLIEGACEAALLEAACREALPRETLVAAGADPEIERGLYQLQYSRCKTPGTAG